MYDELVAVFEAHNFETQLMSWDHVVEHQNLAPLRGRDLPDTEVGRTLRYLPDMFVVNRELPPEVGIFFVVQDDGTGDVVDNRLRHASSHLPEPVLVVGLDAKGEAWGEWLDSPGSRKPLDRLLSSLH